MMKNTITVRMAALGFLGILFGGLAFANELQQCPRGWVQEVRSLEGTSPTHEEIERAKQSLRGSASRQCTERGYLTVDEERFSVDRVGCRYCDLENLEDWTRVTGLFRCGPLDPGPAFALRTIVEDQVLGYFRSEGEAKSEILQGAQEICSCIQQKPQQFSDWKYFGSRESHLYDVGAEFTCVISNGKTKTGMP